ncbi:Phosphoserine phosphatase [Candidozyma auris]
MTDTYSLTFIAHDSTLTSEQRQQIQDFVTSLKNLQILGKEELSKDRVIDFQVTTSTPDIVKNTIRSQIEQHDLAYDIEDKVAEITERAMNGEIDFTESLRERVLLLKGIDATTLWDELKLKLRITNGARELCKALKSLGIVMGVCSGGFLPLASFVKEQLGLDYAYANNLGVDKTNKLDGTTFGPIVNGEMKAQLLLEIAQKHGIDPQTAVAVGDGANDLKMMSVAGFGIAWNAKPKVQLEAPCCLNTNSLKDILYIMGFNDEAIKRLIE